MGKGRMVFGKGTSWALSLTLGQALALALRLALAVVSSLWVAVVVPGLEGYHKRLRLLLVFTELSYQKPGRVPLRSPRQLRPHAPLPVAARCR
ncbi:hypothetical protein Cni_G04660 [Canna indica]|uniref:Uncharacterized protein n=1 Tax=Canna indica TaxID=4628 RepID=A0AAQ3JV74_9LILI|nr:hypothetical protein Cni_G04660 [Canna indica]